MHDRRELALYQDGRLPWIHQMVKKVKNYTCKKPVRQLQLLHDSYVRASRYVLFRHYYAVGTIATSYEASVLSLLTSHLELTI
jgi:hypothetical protein